MLSKHVTADAFPTDPITRARQRPYVDGEKRSRTNSTPPDGPTTERTLMGGSPFVNDPLELRPDSGRRANLSPLRRRK